MEVEIPNLWPLDAIKVDVRTPLDILRAQAGQLQQASQGLLESQVNTTETEKGVAHQFDIIAPALGNYRHTIMTVRHSGDMPYPVQIQSIADVSYEEFKIKEQQITIQTRTPSLLSSFGDGTRVLDHQERLIISREAYTEDDFIFKVRYILRSGKVVALIQSLLARVRTSVTPTRPDESLTQD